jgi:hypothetical protein
VGVGKKAHVEDEVGINGDAVFVAEAEAGDEEVVEFFVGAEAGLDVGAELVHVEIRGIDEDIGDVADGVKELALFNNGAGDGLHAAQGVGAACLAVAADENLILRVEEDDRGGDEPLDVLEDIRKTVEGLALANIDDNSCMLNLSRVSDEFGEVWEEFEGEIINGLKAEVFEGSQDTGFARAGDSGHDDELFATRKFGGFNARHREDKDRPL